MRGVVSPTTARNMWEKFSKLTFISSLNVDIDQREVINEDQSIYDLKIIVHSASMSNLTSSSLIKHGYKENLAITNGDIEYTVCCMHR